MRAIVSDSKKSQSFLYGMSSIFKVLSFYKILSHCKIPSLDKMSSLRKQECNPTIKSLLHNSKLDKLDTQILLGYILGFSKVELKIRDDYQLKHSEYQRYVKLYDECLSGKPIAYILGYKEFYSHNFKVSPATLIPRPETELLVDTVLDLAKPEDKILDLGTGSGCIAISLKLENQSLEITATDKYSDTLKVAIENAANLGAKIEFIQSDWFSNISKSYDIIVSNPPYIEVNDEHLHKLTFEPQFALTDFANGMSAIEHIIQNSVKNLKGYLLLEHGYNQAKVTRDLMLSAGYQEVKTIKDYANLDRITIGRME